MKLLWFHLMPYTDLPEDFTEKHPSVWVDIDSRLFDPRKAHVMYNEFMDELEFAAEMGFDGICVNEHQMERLGKDANPFRAGFLQFVGVAESRDEAMDLYREPAEYFYRRCLHVDPRYAMPPGYASEATLRARVESQIVKAARLSASAAQRGASGGPRMEDIVERGYVIVGSPDEVAEQLREVAETLNVGQLMLLLQFGNMGRQLTNYNTELFAKSVMPQLSGLFENEWENRWWPRPLPMEERATPRDVRP